MIEFTSDRPAQDILSRVVRVTIAGTVYELPVRSIKTNREWKAKLDASTANMVAAMDSAGDDLGGILTALDGRIDPLLDALVSYAPDILPSKAELEAIEPDPSLDIVTAVQEVWRAASPLVVSGIRELANLIALPTTGSSTPSSSPRRNTTGSPKRSKRN